jgi:hypothetical protein
MLVIYPANGDYRKGGDFPLVAVPTDMEGANQMELNDFQWWSYSEDFQKWLKENPREWTAESLVQEPDSEGWLQMLKENHTQRLLDSISEGKKVSSFEEFSALNEEEKVASKEEGKDGVKLHYAYNKLLSSNKLESEFKVRDVNGEKGVFLCLEDPQSGQNIEETLYALKMSPISVGSTSKVKIFNVEETLPGGKLAEDANPDSLGEWVIDNGKKVVQYGIAGAALYGGLKVAGVVGGAIGLRAVGRSLTGGASKKALEEILKKLVGETASEATGAQASKGILSRMAAGTSSGFKTFFGTPVSAVVATGAGLKGAVQAAKAGTGVLAGFSSGMKTSLQAASQAGKFNPWVLLVQAVMAGQKLWNWFSGNQAPRYAQVEDFAFGNFKPAEIKIGVPITVCWTQEAGGVWGVLSWVGLGNDTRTTMEIVKIADVGGNSIFILLQVNSKNMSKQLQEHDLTLISFADSENFERGYLDNDDLELKIKTIDGLSNLSSVYNFMGACAWNEIVTTWQGSSGQYIESDESAPDKYSFHFSDSEDNIINVLGTKVTSEDLSKFNDKDIVDLFQVDKVKGDIGPKDTDKKEAEVEIESATESIWNSPENKKLLEGQVITSFSDFNKITSGGLFEADTVKDPGEGEEAVDTKKDQKYIGLTSEQKTDPAKVAIYLVTAKEYANPELRGKYSTGKFTNFMISKKDYDAKDGEPIDAEPNTTEPIDDPKAGIYKFKKEEEAPVNTQPLVKDEEVEDKKDQEEEEKKDDYYITVDPNDVEIKNKKSSSIIKDKSVEGGVNIFDEFLTDNDKDILKIENWKTVTFVKEFYDNRGDVIEVKIMNRYAPWGDRKRRYKATDGEQFELAKKFASEVKDRIKYE